MTDPKPIQSEGRDANGAIPGGKPDASTSDATEVGDTFKRPPA